MVLWRPIKPFRTNTQKRCPFHYRGLECKSRKSRNTWSNRQMWRSMEWSRAKANRALPRERTGHSKHPLPTTQEKTLYMDITRWSTLKSDCLYSLQPKMESSIQSAKTRPGANCSSDHELLIAKFRLKLKKVGKTTRPFRYDLNQIPYDYTVEVRNTFKELDLIHRVPDELWTRFMTLPMIHDRNQDHPQEKEMQKSKVAIWGGLTNSCEGREVKSKGEKERYTHLKAEFQRIARRVKNAFLSDQCKEIEENNRMGKSWDLFYKRVPLSITSGDLHVACYGWRLWIAIIWW